MADSIKQPRISDLHLAQLSTLRAGIVRRGGLIEPIMLPIIPCDEIAHAIAVCRELVVAFGLGVEEVFPDVNAAASDLWTIDR